MLGWGLGGVACALAIVALMVAGRGTSKEPPKSKTPDGVAEEGTSGDASNENAGPENANDPPGASTPASNAGPPSAQATDLRKSIASEAAKRAESAGPPPNIRTGQASILGSPGALDALARPSALPIGQLPFLQGLDHLASLEPAKAIARFDEAVRADGQNSRFYTARGAAYVLSEKMPQGIPDLQRAMKLDPQNVLASRLMRLALLMQGDQLNASKFHGHGGHSNIDFLITEVGVGYGHRAIAAQSGRPPETRDQMQADAAVKKLPTVMRLVASAFRTGDEQSSQALFSLGVAQFEAKDYPGARRSFESVVEKHPTDGTARYYLARSTLECGDPESARGELTYLLCWSRFLPEAFAARALCAARQNDSLRAQKDLATAKRLDPAKAAEAEATVAQEKARPKAAGAEADAAGWDRLMADARRNPTFESLAASALALRQSVDSRRLRWDETYQDRLFDLAFAAREHPGDADRLADVAEFLRENHRVISLQVAPNGVTHPLRRQPVETKAAEIELAYALAEEGLQANPRHARSWALKSAILLNTYGQLTEAERSAEYAVEFDPKLIAGHMALSDCYKEFAVRLRERAAALRAPKPETRTVRIVDRNGNFVRTDTETFYVPASPEELAQAAECDRQAAIYEQKAQASLSHALAAAKGTKQEPFYQALLLFFKKDFQGARGWLEKAVAQNPDDPVMRHRLANTLDALGLRDAATEELARAINLQQTTGEVWLQVAWIKLEQTRWDEAAQAIQRARALDPSDARAAAFQSVLEDSGRNDSPAAHAAAQVALAQEEARARSNQSTFQPSAESGRLLAPDDVGLTMMLRLREAKRVFATRPAAAAELYLANAALEPRLNEWNLAGSVPAAMLPFVDRDPKQTPGGPPLVALLKNNRIYAGQALLNANRVAEAATQFAAAEGFAHRLPAGGTAYLEFELESQYVPFRVSSMPIYAKLLNGAALIQQKRLNEARIELQQVRYYLANRSLEQRQMTDDPIPAMYQQLAPIVGLR